jgi:hypothetical protein
MKATEYELQKYDNFTRYGQRVGFWVVRSMSGEPQDHRRRSAFPGALLRLRGQRAAP